VHVRKDLRVRAYIESVCAFWWQGLRGGACGHRGGACARENICVGGIVREGVRVRERACARERESVLQVLHNI
jgi:hypothetical protein